jgi:hypothetical protein
LSSSFGSVKGNIVLRDAGGDELLVASGPYIISPANKTYDFGLVTLYVKFHALIVGGVNYSMYYSLDGEENQSANLIQHYFGFFPQTGHPEKNYVDSSVELPPLSNGSHSITIFVEGIYWRNTHFGPYSYVSSESQTVHFTVCSPVVLLLEDTYNKTEVPLDFTVNEPASQFIYSLDNQKNVTISGNTTLDGLTEGSHTIIVYSNEMGNFRNFDIANFSIIKPLSDNKYSPIALLTFTFPLLILLVSIVALRTIFPFLKKRKRGFIQAPQDCVFNTN